MWKPIEIKPGDQSFVGKHIRLHECGMSVEVLWVGKKNIFVTGVDFSHNYEWLIPINGPSFFGEYGVCSDTDWNVFTKFAPAFYKEYGYGWRLSVSCFPTLERARKYLGGVELIWPAIPNTAGFYEVPNEL